MNARKNDILHPIAQIRPRLGVTTLRRREVIVMMIILTRTSRNRQYMCLNTGCVCIEGQKPIMKPTNTYSSIVFNAIQLTVRKRPENSAKVALSHHGVKHVVGARKTRALTDQTWHHTRKKTSTTSQKVMYTAMCQSYGGHRHRPLSEGIKVWKTANGCTDLRFGTLCHKVLLKKYITHLFC